MFFISFGMFSPLKYALNASAKHSAGLAVAYILISDANTLPSNLLLFHSYPFDLNTLFPKSCNFLL